MSVNLAPFRNRTKQFFLGGVKYLQQLEKYTPLNHLFLPPLPLQFQKNSSSSHPVPVPNFPPSTKTTTSPFPFLRFSPYFGPYIPNRFVAPHLPSQVADERSSRLQRHRCHDHQSGPWPKAWTNLGFGFGSIVDGFPLGGHVVIWRMGCFWDGSK